MNASKSIHKADKVARMLKSGIRTGHKGDWKKIASKAERRLNKAYGKAHES